jgi:hypothetical protein
MVNRFSGFREICAMFINIPSPAVSIWQPTLNKPKQISMVVWSQ